MSCYSPGTAWQTKPGAQLTFSKSAPTPTAKKFKIACGNCLGCRLDYSSDWATRCYHEAQLTPQKSFLTLTYAPEFLPHDQSISKRELWLFIKRLRKHHPECRIRYLACGEYGDDFSRPHYHAIIFGYDFPDRKPFGKGGSGQPMYISDELTKIWGKGHCTIGDVTYKSSGYVARYIMKKLKGNLEEQIDPETGLSMMHHYYDATTDRFRETEFLISSTNPGIGYDFYQKYKADIYPADFCIIDGIKRPVPRYYDRLLAKEDPQLLERLKEERQAKAEEHVEDQTPDRLKVRKEVLVAKTGGLKRA